MKAREELKYFRSLSTPELEHKVEGFREELMNIRFRHVSRQLDHTAQLKTIRRSIARAQTVLSQIKGADSVQS